MKRPAFSTYLVLVGLLCGVGCTNQVGGGGTADLAGSSDPNQGPFTDFPAQPILEPPAAGGLAVPDNAAALFGPAGSGSASGGPCLSEPETGALIPNNWLRMRVRFNAPSGQNLFEIRLHAANQTQDLVVYTTQTQWLMPATMWARLAEHSADQPLTISVRGAQLVGTALMGPPALGTSGDITIAPAPASGTIVYWTTSGGTVLKGFTIGEETVHTILRPPQASTGTQCVGCHSSTPDGLFVAFSQTAVPDNGDPASLGLRSVDQQATEPSYLTASSRSLLARVPQQAPTFSGAHYSPGDRIALTAFLQNNRFELAWTDLEAKGVVQGTDWGILARTGDPNPAGSPAFSHSGQSIAYTSAASLFSGVTAASSGDLRVIPYANRAGGTSTPVAGASEPQWNEFYPNYSPDDSLLAFTRAPAAESSYNNPHSEIALVPTAGGTAVRVAGNDPPACTGGMSPGVTNSWPKWSPQTIRVGNKQYYWLTFSSTRLNNSPQLFVIGVVVEGTTITTYRALYLWNQPENEANHTAAWDVFKIIVG